MRYYRWLSLVGQRTSTSAEIFCFETLQLLRGTQECIISAEITPNVALANDKQGGFHSITVANKELKKMFRKGLTSPAILTLPVTR